MELMPQAERYVLRLVCGHCTQGYLAASPVTASACLVCAGRLAVCGVWDMVKDGRPSWWQEHTYATA